MGKKTARLRSGPVKLQQQAQKSSKTRPISRSMNIILLSLPALLLAFVFCYSWRDRAPNDTVFATVNRSLDSIDRRSGLSLQEYRDLYDGKWPVLITGAMNDWPASTKWDWDYFLERYASHRVAMKAVHGKLNNYEMLSVPLKLFSQHVHEASANSWTYINDELFIPFRPELLLDIKRPVYMEEDFFKLLPRELQPWDTMLLWGTSFSRSSLHIDPYNWTGTNAVLKGRKKWKLFPPGQDHLLYVRKNQRCGFPLDCFKYNSEVDAFDPDFDVYPLFAKAKYIEFEQLPGELLMIPTGWFHQAYNPEECLAISSQVYNSQNIKMVTEEILKIGEVKRSKIPDDFDTYEPREQVEALVKAIPTSIVKKGKEVTEKIASQFREAH